MFGLAVKTVFPIGIDVGRVNLKMAQLGLDKDDLYLYAAAAEQIPVDIEYGSVEWQRWVAASVKSMVSFGRFSSKEVIAAIPRDDVFIEQLRIEVSGKDDIERDICAKMADKLPFDVSEAIVKNVATTTTSANGKAEVLVMAAHRRNVDRHLAIYENAGLNVNGIGVWPIAMTDCYVRFFGRRTADFDTIAMLMSVENDYSNIVICKHKDILFARTVSIGFCHFGQTETVNRLISEIDACCRHLESFYTGSHVERLVFFSGRSVHERICEKISELAQRMQVPAQIGDVLAAVNVDQNCKEMVDRRGSQLDWSLAFGLSLAGAN